MCSRPEVQKVHFIEITLNYHKVSDLNMIIITDLCDIGMIIIGGIEGGPIE